MAKNEAKIKVSADVSDFKKGMAESNSELKGLRAELKLNETQMKGAGASVSALESKHEILEKQLTATQNKAELLTAEIERQSQKAKVDEAKIRQLKTQLTNVQIAEERLNQAINVCNKELEDQKKASEESESATSQLTDKIEKQQSKLDTLKNKYVDVVLQYGETSDEAKNLERSINDLSGELKQSKTALSNASDKADELDQSLDRADDSADNAGDGFTVLKGTVADLASNAIQAAIGKVSEFIGYLAELPAATMEIRQDMSTLTTSFDNMGFSTETATSTWKDLYAVFGEDDRAVETANNISKMADNQKDLNDWVTITTGVWGTYQDSLPVEGLAEASMETARTGTVTGGLADALNWSSEAATMFAKYMGEDVVTAEDAFNVALSECNSEQERQQLITDTLTKLYGGAAETYRDTAGAQMEAKEATAEQILAENNLATAIEPVTTEFNNLKTQLLEGMQPAIEKVSGLMLDALEWAQEHPTAMKAIAAVIGVVATAFTALSIALGIYTVAQWAANTAMAPMILPVMAVVAAIAAIVAIIIVVIDYWDQIVAACKNAWEQVKTTLSGWGEWINTNVIQPVVNFFKGLWDGIVGIFQSVIDWVKNNWKSIVLFLVNPFAGVFNYLYENFEGFRNFINNIVNNIKEFFVDLWNGIKQVWDWICNAVQVAIMFIGSIISAAFDIITLPFRLIWENCKQYVFAAWEWIKNKVTIAINAVKNTITTVFNAVKNFFVTVWNGIKNVFTTVWNAIVGFLTPIINKIKNTITTAFNTIKTTITTIFNAVKSVVMTVWNAIKTAISTVANAIRNTVTTVFNAIKTKVTSIFNGIKSVATSVWNAIKNAITTVVNGVKNTISNVFNSVKSTVSSVFNGIKSTATSVWNGIKNAITGPIEAAKDKVKSVIDAIKGFFSGLKLKLPDIKLPHFSIEGKLSLSPPSVPKLKIDWYKEGGILTRPTIFGANGLNFMAGGEAGPEAVLPIDKLENYIAGAIERHMNVVNLDSLAAAVEDLANRPVVLNINDRQFAVATASAGDSVNGLRSSFKSRGLVIE